MNMESPHAPRNNELVTSVQEDTERKAKERKYNEENPFTDPVIAEQWARSVEQEEGLWRDNELYPTMRTWLDTFSNGNTVVLDIGSGQGKGSTALTNYGTYIGVEPSTFLTERAKTLYSAENRKFLIGNAYEIPLPDKSVDGALSVNVWFHLSNINQASQELARVLKPGGSFFINTADNDSLELWKTFYVNPVIDADKMEGEVKVPVNNMTRNTFYFHSNQQIVDTLKAQGLEVTKQTKSLDIDGQTLFITFEGKKFIY